MVWGLFVFGMNAFGCDLLNFIYLYIILETIQ